MIEYKSANVNKCFYFYYYFFLYIAFKIYIDNGLWRVSNKSKEKRIFYENSSVRNNIMISNNTQEEQWLFEILWYKKKRRY